MIRPRHAIALLLVVPVLTACGGASDEPSTSPSTQLKNADDVKAKEDAESAQEIAFGEFAEIDGFGRASVTSPKVGGDSLGPWLEVKVRFENTSGEENSTPDVSLFCTGDTESGGYQADSTISLGELIPGESYKEGTLHLLPASFTRTGEPEAECKTPAFIRITPMAYEEGAGLPSIAVPDELITELNERRRR